jgi:uncharacterized membrane protein
MSKRAASLALLCALVGLGASAAAAYTHYHMLYDPSYRSFCDVNETISCTQVYQSRFSTVRGIPVAIFGAMWFAVAALLSVSGLTARQSVRESVPGYLFALSTLSLAVVLYLGYASFFLLKTVCLLCVTTYAAVIGLFLITGGATSFPMTTLPRRAVRDLRVLVTSPLALTLAVLFFAGAASTLAFFPREGFRRSASDHAGLALGARALHGHRAANAARYPGRRRQGAHRQVQRLPVPGVRPVVPAVQADPGEIRSDVAGPGQTRHAGLPLEPDVQFQLDDDDPPGGVRCRGGRAAGETAQPR